MDGNNCGTCGNQCQSGEICCSGRCVAREDSERFCEFCGYLGGWPQDCLSNEICDRGICVAQGAFTKTFVVVTCAERPELPDPPQIEDPGDYVNFWIGVGCWPQDGVTLEARTADGRLVDSCVPAGGVCSLSGEMGDLPLTVAEVGLDPGISPLGATEITASLLAWSYPWSIVNVGGSQPESPADPPKSDVLQPAGDLAYSVKNGDHWDIWVYSFDTQQNTQLTSEPNSDQWAPAYSHDGATLAYLSDQANGSNQIWLMNPDGSNQRQITEWPGAESILYVAWSPDDSQLIVTLFGDDRRLVLMPSQGGGVEFTDFVGPSSSFATTGVKGAMLYASDNGGSGSTIYLSYFYDLSQSSPYADGDTPNLTPDGMYAAVQIGEPGSRSIETYTLSPTDSALPSVPRTGDDSNPVWLTTDHAHLAFVSASASGETIQVCRIGEETTTPIEIAPHDRVWYLAKRFAGAGGSSAQPDAIPTLEPLPIEEPGGVTSPDGGGTASLEVHLVDCPEGFRGPDYYGACHGNGIDHMEFILTAGTLHEEASAEIEQSPGPGIARFQHLAPGTYELDLRTKFVKAPAYVFCSPDQGVTVLVDLVLDDYHDPVLVPLNGLAVVCD